MSQSPSPRTAVRSTITCGDDRCVNSDRPLTETDAYRGGIDMTAVDQLTRLMFTGGKSEWRDQAACLGTPAALFFPEKGECNTVDTSRQAKRVCNECPVRIPCLEYALENEPSHGVWGGMTVRERAKERQKREAVPNPDAPYAALVWLADAIAYGEVA